MNTAFEDLYSKDPRAMMMTIKEMEAMLRDAVDHGPLLGPDTKLYEKQGKLYRVTMPCLACLGLKEYDKTIPFVEVLEIGTCE